MIGLATSAQMRALERAEIDSGAVTGFALMERAGQGTLSAILAQWPALATRVGRAAVYCGPGNNGGDGFIIARLLAKRGWQVAVWMIGDPAALPPDARAAFDVWRGVGQVAFCNGAPETVFPGFWDEPPELIVDAILGIGLTRDLGPQINQAVSGIQQYKERRMVHPPMVAVDVPTGLCADSGRNRGNPCKYDLTVTFHTGKPGHYLADGPGLCGALAVVDIGLPSRVDPLPAEVPRLVNGPGPVGKSGGHKFDHGHALVLTGGPGRTGAARLAARGAMRIGAGLVTLGVPPAAQFEVASQITAAMLSRIADAAALESLLEDRRINALCLGPGLGRDRRAAGLVAGALASRRACVLDADAITLLAERPELVAQLHAACVLTPHAGEFARLFPDIAQRLSDVPAAGAAFSKLDATRDAARQVGCTVVFKGPDTVVAAPDGRAAIHSAAYGRAAPWLATAGAGDVLAGIVTGLLARGHAPFESACGAAWLHTQAALAFGPGLIAEDLPEALPEVLRRL
ncbi:NAD(P)H-hydrate dehydratase [Oceaniovalibus sp. ACAM 378]|uniref:NAD(P)H-hydrate dehydratase n=1 Tax=Oceaniovalibus sp. ACAM 378 TaxID=2599923 RepID=UPI0011D6D81F|nr:NAD(P)H-hydrate dehydratase [Oceaniovalibus sp. ACAM 378]TYB87967.1 NAD(P)H-hydrate dehydratase [Oceaniovalibus sp. ACAM 378]